MQADSTRATGRFRGKASRSILSSLALIAGIVAAAPARGDPGTEIEVLIHEPLPAVLHHDRDRELLADEMAEFYTARDYRPAWTNRVGLTRQATALVEAFLRAAEQGLRPGDYVTGPLAPEWMGTALVHGTPRQLALLDAGITLSLMRYVKDLHEGRFSPAALKLGLDVSQRRLDLATQAAHVRDSADAVARINGYAPRYRGYRLLTEQLRRYRNLAREDDWQALSAARTIHPQDPYSEAGLLRRRLELTGDLPAGATSDSLVYSADLVAAAKRFQHRHGLVVDGVLGQATFAQLNRSWADKAAQIAASLERWRWIPEPRDGRAIVVNVPEYRLRAVRIADDELAVEFESRVIVGKAYHRTRTPIFSDTLEYLVFRPYWNVPSSITRGEIVPHIGDSGYLQERDMEIVSRFGNDVAPVPPTEDNLRRLADGSLHLRQRPGPNNALGLVKFIFPNAHNVYLHSTPAKELFGRARRTFSHGCIRVQDPVGLAGWVLRDQPEWSAAQINAAMNGDTTAQVTAVPHTPVFILYVTAFVDPEDGLLYFYDDIYGLDGDLIRALGDELSQRV